MHSFLCGVCFALTAATSTASGQIILQDQFLHGGNTAAGEYVWGIPINGQGPQGGSLIGFADAWEAPVSEDNLFGTAYADSGGLSYQVGPERLITEGGSYLWVRHSPFTAQYASWRETDPHAPRSDWWFSALFRLSDMKHGVNIHFEMGLEDPVGGLNFGIHFWGTPFISETVGESSLLEDRDHFLVAHFYEDPIEGERVELWVNPVRLRPTLTGDPPLPPNLADGSGGDNLVDGADSIDYVTVWQTCFESDIVQVDEIRAGGSWADVVPVAVEPGCNGADVAEPLGVLDLNDVTAFVDAFVSGYPIADLASPAGILDLSDVTAFIDAFLGGCP
jgi:hypothetical protein